MRAQYVAQRSCCGQVCGVFESQTRASVLDAYIFTPVSRRLALVAPLRSLTSKVRRAGPLGSVTSCNDNRRNRCPRASSFWRHSALWSLWPHVHVSSKLKNSSWSTLSRSRPNRRIPGSTSKLSFAKLPGRSAGADPTQPSRDGGQPC